MHYMWQCNTLVLGRSVYETWDMVEISSVISNVLTKLKNIICLIDMGDR